MKLIKYEYPRLPGVFDTDRWFADLFNSYPRWLDYDDYADAELRSLEPPADLYDDSQNYYVRIEFPGFKKNELKIDLEGEVLTVSAEHKEGEETTSYSRSISVPEGAIAEKVEAKYEDGILTVTLPKQEQRKPKAIEIK